MGQIYVKGLGLVPDSEENKALLTPKKNDNPKKKPAKSNSDTTTRPSGLGESPILVDTVSE